MKYIGKTSISLLKHSTFLHCIIDSHFLLRLILPEDIVYFSDLLSGKYEHLRLWTKVNCEAFNDSSNHKGLRVMWMNNKL